MIFRFTLGALALSTASLLHADTITVGVSGTGADYDSIQSAVNAALPGDLILVGGGEIGGGVNGFADGPIVIDKALTIIGPGRTSSLIYTFKDSQGGSSVPLQIRDLGPGDAVRIVGLHFANSEEEAVLLNISNCDGPVVISGMTAELPLYAGIAFSKAVVMISDSKQVSLDSCDFESVSGSLASFDYSNFSFGQSGLYAFNSNVTISDCSIGGAQFDPNSGSVAHGGVGVEAVQSNVQISNSTIGGGNGTPQLSLPNPNIAGDGGAAVVAMNSQVLVSGNSTLRGGSSGSATLPVGATGGAALMLFQGSSAITANGERMTTGRNSDNSVGALVQGAGTHVALGEALASMDLPFEVLALGDAFALTLAGEPGATLVPYFSAQQRVGRQFGVLVGSVYLDLGDLSRLPSLNLGATGQGTLSLSIPLAPALAGQSFLMQSLSRSTQGTLSISPPSVLAIR